MSTTAETITTTEVGRERFVGTVRGVFGPAIVEVVTLAHTSDTRPYLHNTCSVEVDGVHRYSFNADHETNHPAHHNNRFDYTLAPVAPAPTKPTDFKAANLATLTRWVEEATDEHLTVAGTINVFGQPRISIARADGGTAPGSGEEPTTSVLASIYVPELRRLDRRFRLTMREMAAAVEAATLTMLAPGERGEALMALRAWSERHAITAGR